MKVKHLLQLLAAGVVLYASYQFLTSDTTARDAAASITGTTARAPGTQVPKDRYLQYTTQELAEMDVPRDVIFDVFKHQARTQCWMEVRDIRQNGEQCTNLQDRRHAACSAVLALKLPTVIRGQDVTVPLRACYARCVNPVRYHTTRGLTPNGVNCFGAVSGFPSIE